MANSWFKKVMVTSIVVYVNFALFFVGYMTVSNTVKDDYQIAIKKTGQLKDEFERVWHKKQNRDVYDIQQKKIIEQITLLKRRLPGSLTAGQIRGYLAKSAKRNNVTIKEMDEITNVEAEFYITHDWSMTMSGKYPDLIRLLYELQNDGDLIVTTSAFYMNAFNNDEVQLEGEFHGYHYPAYPEIEEIYQQLKSEYEVYDAAH